MEDTTWSSASHLDSAFHTPDAQWAAWLSNKDRNVCNNNRNYSRTLRERFGPGIVVHGC